MSEAVTPENVASLPENAEADTVPSLPPLDSPHGGKVYLNPFEDGHFTHVTDTTVDGKPAASISTIGGVVFTVLHAAEDIARLLGWID